jgi:uncharacterized Zn-finger protein
MKRKISEIEDFIANKRIKREKSLEIQDELEEVPENFVKKVQNVKTETLQLHLTVNLQRLTKKEIEKWRRTGKKNLLEKKLECKPRLKAQNRFQCEICPKNYSRKPNLNAHLKLHENPELFKCQICGVNSTSNYHLKRHLSIHEKICEKKTEVLKQ